MPERLRRSIIENPPGTRPAGSIRVTCRLAMTALLSNTGPPPWRIPKWDRRRLTVILARRMMS